MRIDLISAKPSLVRCDPSSELLPRKYGNLCDAVRLRQPCYRQSDLKDFGNSFLESYKFWLIILILNVNRFSRIISQMKPYLQRTISPSVVLGLLRYYRDSDGRSLCQASSFVCKALG